MRKSQSNIRGEQRRSGVAAVEVAVCMPILLMITFGVIESCNLIYFKQSLTVAAYEGARAAITSDSAAETVTDRTQQVLTDRRVQGATITMNPADPRTADYGDSVLVSVSANYSQNAILPGWFFGNRTVAANIRMMKEF